MSKITTPKPKIGITIGDYNGIGPEIILKAFSDNRLFDFCIPVVYGSTKILAYHKKNISECSVSYQQAKPQVPFSQKALNVINCIDENVIINLGNSSQQAGSAALKAIDTALEDLKNGVIDALVTAPIDKSTITISSKSFTGHTEYIADFFNAADSLMLLSGDKLKVALVTQHLPLKEVAESITPKKIIAKLEMLHISLFKDFGIMNPKIAVLALNPHAGDNGLLGNEEKEIILPAINKAKENGILAFGPYSADGFFGTLGWQKFDAVLAMYHDQGLIPFKSICFDTGINFTAGLPIVRTSPDHGTAFDIAGKDLAQPESFIEAIFQATEILKNRTIYSEITANPLKRQSIESER